MGKEEGREVAFDIYTRFTLTMNNSCMTLEPGDNL